MISNYYGIGGSFFDTYFGNNSSSDNSATNSLFSSLSAGSSASAGSSFVSSLGDLNMIKSGVYKKALKAYYDTVDSDELETISGSGKADSNNSLSLVKSSAKELNESAKELQSMDFDKADREDILANVKDFAEDYNSMLNSTKNLNSYSMLQTAVWATKQVDISEGLLEKVGIKVGEDNTLSVDEDTFKKANVSDIKALFEGNGSLASRISQKASTLTNQSANQMALNQGKATYTMYGTWN